MNVENTSSEKTELIKTLRKVLRKQVQEKVLDICDLPLGQTNENILDYLRIAQENNFNEEAYLLKESIFDLGEAQIRKITEPRRKIRRVEDDLEKFLSQGENLTRIEQGLRFKEKQRRISSGRLDIVAEDNSGNEVLIELKAREYNSKDVWAQLLKYMHENPENRTIFAAPRIKPDLFYEIKPYVDIGRLEFFEFEFENQIPVFTRINEENLNKNGKKKINLDKKSRKKEGVITIVKPTKEDRRFEGGEEIEQGTFSQEWDSYPLFYQLLLKTRPDIKDIEKYLQPIFVSEKRKRSLESLIFPEFLKKAVERVDYLVSVCSIAKDMNEKIRLNRFPESDSKILEITYDAFLQYKATIRSKLDYFLGRLKQMASAKNLLSITAEENEKINRIDKKQLLITHEGLLIVKNSEEIKNHPFQFSLENSFKKSLEKLNKEFKNISSEREIKHLGSLLRKSNLGREAREFYEDNLLIQLELLSLPAIKDELKLKLMRAEELGKVDENLAYLYLFYIPEQSENEKTLPKDYYGIKQDHLMYKSILNHLRVQENSEEPQEIKTTNEPQRTILPEPKTDYTTLRLTKAILNGSLNLTEDMQLRIKYFEQDATQYGLTEQDLEKLSTEFAGFNLSRKMKRNETKLDDLRFRNFFDDITLKYVMHGKVPNKHEIEHLYEQEMKEAS